MSEMIEVEVVYGRPDKQVLLSLPVPSGTTIKQCIILSGIRSEFPEIDVDNAKVGIFSRVEKLDTALKDGDRVEIYRPLTADPKEMRKLRAAKAKK